MTKEEWIYKIEELIGNCVSCYDNMDVEREKIEKFVEEFILKNETTII